MFVPCLHRVKVNSDVLLFHGPPVGLINSVSCIKHVKLELLNSFSKELDIRAPVKCEVDVSYMFIKSQLIDILDCPLQFIL